MDCATFMVKTKKSYLGNSELDEDEFNKIYDDRINPFTQLLSNYTLTQLHNLDELDIITLDGNFPSTCRIPYYFNKLQNLILTNDDVEDKVIVLDNVLPSLINIEYTAGTLVINKSLPKLIRIWCEDLITVDQPELLKLYIHPNHKVVMRDVVFPKLKTLKLKSFINYDGGVNDIELSINGSNKLFNSDTITSLSLRFNGSIAPVYPNLKKLSIFGYMPYSENEISSMQLSSLKLRNVSCNITNQYLTKLTTVHTEGEIDCCNLRYLCSDVSQLQLKSGNIIELSIFCSGISLKKSDIAGIRFAEISFTNNDELVEFILNNIYSFKILEVLHLNKIAGERCNIELPSDLNNVRELRLKSWKIEDMLIVDLKKLNVVDCVIKNIDCDSLEEIDLVKTTMPKLLTPNLLTLKYNGPEITENYLRLCTQKCYNLIDINVNGTNYSDNRIIDSDDEIDYSD